MVYYFPVQNLYLKNLTLMYPLKYSRATECYITSIVDTSKKSCMIIFIFGEQIYLYEKERNQLLSFNVQIRPQKLNHKANLKKQKFFFFSQDSKETCSLICVSVIIKVYQEDIPFVKTIHMYVFIKAIIGKTNYYWHVHFLFDLY